MIRVEGHGQGGQGPGRGGDRPSTRSSRSLKTEPLSAEELQKIKNQAKANAYRRLSSPFSIAIQLMIYDGFGDWRYINTYAEEVDRVTAADIQRTAKEYFTRRTAPVGVFLRKGGAPPPTTTRRWRPCPRPRRPWPASRSHGSRPRRTRPSCARASPRWRRRRAQVPPEMKPVLDLILKRAQERLAALEGQKK